MKRYQVYVSGTFALHHCFVLEVQYSNRVLAINTRTPCDCILETCHLDEQSDVLLIDDRIFLVSGVL